MGSGPALAQSTRGSAAGTIRDAQGAAVPGATIELRSPRRNDTQVATANEAGDFVFLNLLPDTYDLKVSMDSFKTVERANVVVNAADRLSLGVITLELGAVSATVTVSPRVGDVQSRSAERTFASLRPRATIAVAKAIPLMTEKSRSCGFWNIQKIRE